MGFGLYVLGPKNGNKTRQKKGVWRQFVWALGQFFGLWGRPKRIAQICLGFRIVLSEFRVWSFLNGGALRLYPLCLSRPKATDALHVRLLERRPLSLFHFLPVIQVWCLERCKLFIQVFHSYISVILVCLSLACFDSYVFLLMFICSTSLRV